MYRNTVIFFITQLILCQHGISAKLGQYPRRPDDETADKIVGGEPTEEGRYPYQVGLSSFEGSVRCGGSLIDSNWVLSAVHCTGAGSHVEIGRYDLSNFTETFELIEIAFEMKHPNYNNRTEQNDLMLLRLKEPSTYDPVTLDDGSSSLAAGTDVTVMGWGATEEGGFGSDILLEVEVDVISGTDCNAADSYNGDVDEDLMICAAREGKDSCQGDSGGPLIIKGDDAASDIQVGVVSWGFGCAQEDYPGVYASVEAGLSFIEDGLSCEFADGDDDSSLEDCCNVVCQDGVFTCEECPEPTILGSIFQLFFLVPWLFFLIFLNFW